MRWGVCEIMSRVVPKIYNFWREKSLMYFFYNAWRFDPSCKYMPNVGLWSQNI